MSAHVVDLLEAVEIEDRQTQDLLWVTGRARDRGREHVVELAAVEQSGERIAPRPTLVVLEHPSVVERERRVIGERFEQASRAVVRVDRVCQPQVPQASARGLAAQTRASASPVSTARGSELRVQSARLEHQLRFEAAKQALEVTLDSGDAVGSSRRRGEVTQALEEVVGHRGAHQRVLIDRIPVGLSIHRERIDAPSGQSARS